MTPEITDQCEVGVVPVLPEFAVEAISFLQRRPRRIGQGEIVVKAGNRLHAFAVAVRQPVSVNGFRAADIGTAVLPDRYALVIGQAAGHASAPE